MTEFDIDSFEQPELPVPNVFDDDVLYKSSASPVGFKPLSGEWRHGNGFLICGTLRIARADFDTCPSEEMKHEIFDWIVKTLNKA